MSNVGVPASARSSWKSLIRSALSREPTLSHPVSQACTLSQLDSADAHGWYARMEHPYRRHRKLWEWVYIAQVLALRGQLQNGKRGLGFGVGTERLTDLFASFGCRIVATDLDEGRAADGGWVETHQHAAKKGALWHHLSDKADFDRLVDFQVADMNDIPPSLKGFDFTWSACSLEHLGDLEKGLSFIENSLACLRPGGVAVHTTEFNCSSNTDTVESGWCVLYRKKDLQAFAKRMAKCGHKIAPMNFNLGHHPDDAFIDLPPYKHDPHLKLRLESFDTTSFGLIIERGD